MFALTCPHCKTEIQTRFARPGATVKCTKCQQTFLLDARNTREMAGSGVAGSGQAPLQPGQLSESKAAMVAMQEMSEQMGELAPEVDIYSAAPLAPGPGVTRFTWLIIALSVLILVVVGAVWLFATTPAMRDLFGSRPAVQASPNTHPKPAPAKKLPDGTTPAEF